MIYIFATSKLIFTQRRRKKQSNELVKQSIRIGKLEAQPNISLRIDSAGWAVKLSVQGR